MKPIEFIRKAGSSVILWFIVNLIFLFALLYVHIFSEISKNKWWPDLYNFSLNLLIGGVVSFIFYYLVVFIPQKRKKETIKNASLNMYFRIKRDIMWQVLFASMKGGRQGLESTPDFVDKLLGVQFFRDTFSGGREANEGFYAFENQMTSSSMEFDRIVQNLRFLARQIEYVLHNCDITNEDLFQSFKRMEIALLSLQETKPGYDESEPLTGFIFRTFAGWDPVDGYIGYDRIQRALEEL